MNLADALRLHRSGQKTIKLHPAEQPINLKNDNKAVFRHFYCFAIQIHG
jgi:hypothetical protein